MVTMFILPKKFFRLGLWLLVLIVFLSACSTQSTPAAVETPTVVKPTATPTALEPTVTSVPAAAVVNDERIPLAWFESEFARYLIAREDLGNQDVDEDAARETVLNNLIDLTLFAQAAQEAGFSISDEAVQSRLDQLAGEVDLSAWMAAWGYTEEDLRHSLKLEMLAAKQREFIAESVPEVAEQVDLRQVFAYTEEGAENALLSLNSGQDFSEVAFLYDPITGGYLGWVPRGYLLISAVEEAAFNLPVGSNSDIIESDIGFHIVKVLDREERRLTADARLTLQRQALNDWLGEQRQVSTIEVLID
jgi:parvulin-like peptidyl-prolyl isomerase